MSVAETLSLSETARSDSRAVFAFVRGLRCRDAAEPGFWADFVRAAVLLCRADAGVVVVREGQAAWTVAASHAEAGTAPAESARLAEGAVAVATRTHANGFAIDRLDGAVVVASAIDGGGDSVARVMALALTRRTPAQQNEALVRLQLIADVPAHAGPAPAAEPTADAALLAGVLDLMVLVLGCDSFRSACICLCNELASRFRCARVALGWSDDGVLRVHAISHIDKFEARTDAVRDLEAVMEEAFDQDDTIAWPEDAGGRVVTAAHDFYSRRHGAPEVLSLPVRHDDHSVAVVVAERGEEDFDDRESRLLHLAVAQVAPWLVALRRRERSWRERLKDRAYEAAAALARPRHTATKLALAGLAAAVLVLLVGRWDYSVEATAILKTETLAYLPAPFDGFVEDVAVQVGDTVTAGQALLSLDTTEMYLKESEATADILRYARAADKARAQNALADMRIAEAEEQQARARLDRVRYYLDHAKIAAPFDGIVVEGERTELDGAPVKKGDILFKVALLDGLYLDLDVDERDIHEVAVGREGEVVFLGRTDLAFPIRVRRIDPVAVTRPERGGVFVVRVDATGPVPPWWRPGMSGVARIDAEPKRLLWMVGHRTLDFLRLNFWW